MFRNLLRKAGIVAVLLLFGVSSAPAFWVDTQRTFAAREPHEQVVAYYRFTLNYNDQLQGSARQFGALPANAYILAIDADVTTAFNAGTTNPITIGATTTSANEIVASGITSGTPGIYHLTSAAGLGVAVTGNSTYYQALGGSSVVPLYVLYKPTGTAATTGSVTVVIEYTVNNDL
ncbi:MAG: hypothetical protein P4M05_19570 [Bradyrhizobium sp.]|nr:hypothetical protein [Bradyrhizobium sp.]